MPKGNLHGTRGKPYGSVWGLPAPLAADSLLSRLSISETEAASLLPVGGSWGNSSVGPHLVSKGDVSLTWRSLKGEEQNPVLKIHSPDLSLSLCHPCPEKSQCLQRLKQFSTCSFFADVLYAVFGPGKEQPFIVAAACWASLRPWDSASRVSLTASPPWGAPPPITWRGGA